MAEPRAAIVAGQICLDIIPDLSAVPAGKFDQLFQPGHLIEVGAATLTTGGAVSNTGLALHRLGIPTQLIGKVGLDPFGQIVLNIIRTHGTALAAGMVVDPNAVTSYSVILSAPGLDRMILHRVGANDSFGAADVQPDRLRQADLLHFGYPPVMRRLYTHAGQELMDLMRQAKALGLTTSLDMCSLDPLSEAGRADWHAILRNVLPYVDIFLPSLEELLFMLRRTMLDVWAAQRDAVGQATPELLARLGHELIGMGAKIVVIKLGARGAYLRTAGSSTLQEMGRARPTELSAWADQELWAPCFKVDVAGTTGAGDATIAGFLGALLRDAAPETALTMAVAVGACNVEAVDALSGVRSWEATQARVAQGWPRLPLHLNVPDWKWDAQLNVWRK
jgi:sugar/nucleoside kinase (ribokinase family)